MSKASLINDLRRVIYTMFTFTITELGVGILMLTLIECSAVNFRVVCSAQGQAVAVEVAPSQTYLVIDILLCSIS